MKRGALVLVFVVAGGLASRAHAQAVWRAGASAGVADARPSSGSSPSSYGGSADLSLSLTPVDWFSPRAYAGALITFPASPCDTEPDSRAARRAGSDCVGAQIAILGAKARFLAPFSAAQPYLEVGVGASLGSITTRYGQVSERVRGLALHVPLGIGVQFGTDVRFDIMLSLLAHPSEHQNDRSFRIGIEIPIGPPSTPAAPARRTQ